MHSSCYVIIPVEFYSDVENYIERTLAKYYSQMEIDPHKDFCTKEYTYHFCNQRGFGENLEKLQHIWKKLIRKLELKMDYFIK